MAGIYIHIPFCRKLCYYCDFHFTVSLKDKDRLIDSLMLEIQERKEEFKDEVFETIYFGGGTPSVLQKDELIRLFDGIFKNYRITSDPEITFEANPDDLTENYLSDLRKFTPVNRLSIGVQSLHDKDLQLMNRRHNAQEAIDSIKRARKAGFNNINMDLIYGIPEMTTELWTYNLEAFKSLDLEHLSAYHLTFEPKTVFTHYLKKGKLKPVDEDHSVSQFEVLLDFARREGYDHYEISNFAREGFYSRHNLGYWTGKPYLGIGPSAHSYYKNKRRYNIRNNTKYIESLLQCQTEHFETESIDLKTSYNEYMLISLRTKWGINKQFILNNFGEPYLSAFAKSAERFFADGTLVSDQDNVFLSPRGKFIADYVITELLIVD